LYSPSTNASKGDYNRLNVIAEDNLMSAYSKPQGKEDNKIEIFSATKYDYQQRPVEPWKP
jgi:hypothetical protein